ncbi:MAG TPA: DDE transposase [Porphyromonadaceae bacterium]|nr:DDE transposase [Porphyromonadaceae bacterium]
MSYVSNASQQIALDDILNTLTEREKKQLEKSWAKDFSEQIFPRINEAPFSVLYSEKASRPNTPVNVIIGAMMLKEHLGLTDEEVVEAMMFDIRFQYALRTTSNQEQPLSDRSFSRFRQRCLEYEQKTGKDLIHECITGLSEELARVMKISSRLKRMDSLLVSSNIKKLSRLELMYICVSNLVKSLHKLGEDNLLVGMEHYYDPADYNRTIYHNRSEETDNRLEQILADADVLLNSCADISQDINEYRLLSRVMEEQTIREESGKLRMKQKEDGGMNSSILQNPSDPDATYREKAGKQYRGYVANVVESVSENGSIVTDYQYEPNTHSDSEFLRETVESMGNQEEPVVLVTDGAYSSQENERFAAENNIELKTTNLTGREAKDVFADFTFSEDGQTVVSCAAGYAPKSSGKPNQYSQCRVSFNRSHCENCPHRDDCNPKLSNKTAVIHISVNAVVRAKHQREMKTPESKELYKFRNGVESLPSILRRKYNVDNMPVRGLLRGKLWFGLKIAALNFQKYRKHLFSLVKCAQNPVNA